jgi:hypothetical protein
LNATNMTLYEFNLLDINNHITKDEKFNLYAINMFFVEVLCNFIRYYLLGINLE